MEFFCKAGQGSSLLLTHASFVGQLLGYIDLKAPANVQEQQEKDEANAADPEALLRKREREAEEWRVSQLRAGVSAEDNANLQVGPTIQQLCLLQTTLQGI